MPQLRSADGAAAENNASDGSDASSRPNALSESAQAYFNALQEPGRALMKILDDASYDQLVTFQAVTSVRDVPEPTAHDHPHEITFRTMRSIPPEQYRLVTDNVTSKTIFERLLQWSGAPEPMVNFAATNAGIRSDAPGGWQLKTFCHCAVIDDFEFFENEYDDSRRPSPEPRPPPHPTWTPPDHGPPPPARAQDRPTTWNRRPLDRSNPDDRRRHNRDDGGEDRGPASHSSPRWSGQRPPYGSDRDNYQPESNYQPWTRPPRQQRQQPSKRPRYESYPPTAPPHQADGPDDGTIAHIAYDFAIPETTARALAEGRFVPAADCFLATTVSLNKDLQLQKHKAIPVSDDAIGVASSIGALMSAHAALWPSQARSDEQHSKEMTGLIQSMSIRGVWAVDTVIRRYCDVHHIPYSPTPPELNLQILAAALRFPRQSFARNSCNHCGNNHSSHACRYKDINVYAPQASAQTDTRAKFDKNKPRIKRDAKRNRERTPGQPATRASPAVGTPGAAPCRDFIGSGCTRDVCKFSH
jgi:hypothetical protein